MDLVGSRVEDVSAAIAQSFWTKRGGSKTLCPDGTRNFVKEPLGIEIE